MRVRALLLVSILSAPAMAASPAPQAGKTPDANCPRTTSYLADKSGIYQGKPLAPRKLTELPPAIAYMAVYRHIGPCEAPLTMADYRNPRQR
jgi:hypothetical protein